MDRLKGVGLASAIAALLVVLVPASAAAEPESYKPTGPLITDTGFRPAANGYSFENYGPGAPGLSAAEMRKLFGDEVCANAPSDNCELTPPAKEWMDDKNQAMDGGHCYGFSVSALRYFAKQTNPSVFGALTVPGLELRRNIPLARDIAYHFVHQFLDSVQAGTVEGTPAQIVRKLRRELPLGEEHYTVTVYKAKIENGEIVDFEDGHAVTPFAVESRGANRFAILVYDNNFPGKFRDVQVDADANTWRFDGAPNPSVESDLYEGDADTETLGLMPVTPGLGKQPCPFCNGKQNAASSRPGQRSVDVALEGNLRRHAHLLVRDQRGGVIGYRRGKFVRDLEGGQAIRPVEAGRNMRREPLYRVPPGRAYTVELDNTRTRVRDVEGIRITGPGFVLNVRNIRLRGGERLLLTITPDGRDLKVRANRRLATPEFSLGLEEAGADHSFTFRRSSGLAAGRRLALSLDPGDGQVELDGPDGVYDVLMRYVDLEGERVFARRDVDVGPVTNGDEGDVRINYDRWDGDPGDDLVLEGEGGRRDELSSEASPTSDPDDVQDDLAAGRDPE